MEQHGLLHCVINLNPKVKKEEPKEKEEPDFYFENGLMVMTEAYHLKRGYCCGSKCRHCPYDHENVEEDKREE